jgi:hypothetical protein
MRRTCVSDTIPFGGWGHYKANHNVADRSTPFPSQFGKPAIRPQFSTSPLPRHSIPLRANGRQMDLFVITTVKMIGKIISIHDFQSKFCMHFICSYACHMSHLAHISWLGHFNNILREVHVVKFLIVKVCSESYYFISLRSKHSSSVPCS